MTRRRIRLLWVVAVTTIIPVAALASISSSLGFSAAAIGAGVMAIFTLALTAFPYFQSRSVAESYTEARTTTQSVAGLLDPRRALVPFVGRDDELASLIAWCKGNIQGQVHLVTGAGGVGKTRLSEELSGRLKAEDWQSPSLPDEGEATALSEVRRFWQGPTLLVVDYAETRTRLAELLRTVAADTGVVRVLLLARDAGEWWDRLASEAPPIPEMLADAYVGMPLREAVTDDRSNRELVLAAVPAFAAALGVQPPSDVKVKISSSPVRILDLHAAALVAVLQSVNQPSPFVETSSVLDELLTHEQRFWEGTAEHAGLLQGTTGMTVGTIRQIVAAAALLGATSQEQALDLLGRVPGAVASVKVTSWLRHLYPPKRVGKSGNAGDWLGMLEPSRLAERLVVAELSSSPLLAERCLTGLDESQAVRALTLLGRASTDQLAAGQLLGQVLPFLEGVVEGLPADVDLLTQISAAIPFPSIALAEADVMITRRILQALSPDATVMRAHWLSWLSTALAQTGRPADALIAEQKAVQIRRELAAAYPDRYRADLATSLSNLGARYSTLGRPIEGLITEQEAVAIRRELGGSQPGPVPARLGYLIV